MPYIEDVVKENAVMWGEYHSGPSVSSLKTPDRSRVMVKNVGCVFIGTVKECQQYIEENEHRYTKNPRRLLTK